MLAVVEENGKIAGLYSVVMDMLYISCKVKPQRIVFKGDLFLYGR